MDWLKEAENKLKNKRQILLSRDSDLLIPLELLINSQNRKTITLWALDLAKESSDFLVKKYPDEKAIKEVVEFSKKWAEGMIKMPAAKGKILECHDVAKRLDNKSDIALVHAVAQGCSVVHTVKHAMGYPIYELTSIIYTMGIDNCKEAVESRNREYIDRLLYFSDENIYSKRKWADFIDR